MRLKSAVVFAAGCALGAGGMFAAQKTDRSRDVDRVHVAGSERRDVAPAPREVTRPASPAEPAPRVAERAGVSRRTVAREALAVTAWIRGDGVYGAGVVISEHHVLTCLHVIEKMKTIHVSMAEGPFETAQVLERDSALDLAVLRVEATNGAHASIASAVGMEMGDPVFAMGAPRNMNFTLSSGIVSYAGRPYGDLLYLQTDIPTNGGSSGGPVLDDQGRVVAISSFILRESQGLAFALPIDYAYARFQPYFAGRLERAPFDAWVASRRTHAAPNKTHERQLASE